jgi:Tol biopolymer transport system component
VGGAPIRIGTGTEPPPLRVALTWLDDGTILYEPLEPNPIRLVRISENGGEPLADFKPFRTRLAWVHGLPGAAGALVVTTDNGLFLLDLRSSSVQPLMEEVTRAWYSPTGHLVYVRTDGAVFAQPFDLGALELGEGAIPLFEGVRVPDPRTADMHLAADGTVLYVEGSAVASAPAGAQLVVVDLEGNREVLPLSPRSTQGVNWSPDGEFVAFMSEDQIYTYDVVRNTTPRQITFEGTNGTPVYSPDGTRLAFSSLPVISTPTGVDLFVKELEDDSPPRLIASLDRDQVPMQWPTDTLIAFLDGSGTNGPFDLWTLDLSDPDAPEARPYLTSEANLNTLRISPDGTLAAYTSDETGTADVYVRSFPNPGERMVVSRGGGLRTWWSPDGTTLYFGALRGLSITMVAARLRRGPVLAVLSADTLFTVDGITGRPGANALHPDGDRFVFALSSSFGSTDAVEAATQRRVILVQNFFAELLERVGEAR